MLRDTMERVRSLVLEFRCRCDDDDWFVHTVWLLGLVGILCPFAGVRIHVTRRCVFAVLASRLWGRALGAGAERPVDGSSGGEGALGTE